MSRNDATSLGSPWFVAILLLSAAWWTLDLAVLRSGTPHPSDDHWEDFLIAEHLLAGGGFRTHLIYPPLWGLRDPRDLTVPVLVHGPLLPLLAWRHGKARWPSRGTSGAHALDPVLVLVLGFVVVALPWWIHHARTVGSPLFSLTSYTLIGYWGKRPDVSVLQDFSLTPDRWPAVLRAEL